MILLTSSGIAFQLNEVVLIDAGFSDEGDTFEILLSDGTLDYVSRQTSSEAQDILVDYGDFGVVRNLSHSGELVARAEDLDVIEVTKNDLSECEAFHILGYPGDDFEYRYLDSAIAVRFTHPLFPDRVQFFPGEDLVSYPTILLKSL